MAFSKVDNLITVDAWVGVRGTPHISIISPFPRISKVF